MNKQNQSSASHLEPNARIATEAQNGSEASGGRGWHGNPQGHAAAGSKGGNKVSQNREHMAHIGRKGGQSVSRDRQHMAAIGRKGGQARSDSNNEA